MPSITLPDGSQRDYENALSVADVAADIGPGLAKATLAGVVDGTLVDSSTQITSDASLAIITSKDDDGLHLIRHSTAHLMAQAVKQLYPEAQVTIGPVIEDGFYYDFAYERAFTPEDLEAIEKRMAELAKQAIPIVRSELPRDEALAFFAGLSEEYKARSSVIFHLKKCCHFMSRETLLIFVVVHMCQIPASLVTLNLSLIHI